MVCTPASVMVVFPPPPSALTNRPSLLKPLNHLRWSFHSTDLNPLHPPEPPDPPDPAYRASFPLAKPLFSLSRSPLTVAPSSASVSSPVILTCAQEAAPSPNLQRSVSSSSAEIYLAGKVCCAGDVLTRNATIDGPSSSAAGDGYFWVWPIFISFGAEASFLWAWPITYRMIYGLLACTSPRSCPHHLPDFMLNAGDLSSSSLYGMRCLQPSSLVRERSIPLSSFSRERSTPFSSLLGERSLLFSFLNRKRIIPYSPFSLEKDVISDLIPRTLFNLFTNLLSCVAVCSGPEDAFGFVSAIFVGESWFSTSHLKVTISQHSGLAVKVYRTHLTFGSDLLSIYLGVFFTLICISFMCYGSNQRGWIIPSVCILQV